MAHIGMSQENQDLGGKRGGRISEHEVAICRPVERVVRIARINNGRSIRRNENEGEPKEPDTKRVHGNRWIIDV